MYTTYRKIFRERFAIIVMKYHINLKCIKPKSGTFIVGEAVLAIII